MYYENLSYTLLSPLRDYVKDFYFPKRGNFFKEKVASRVGFFVLAFCSAITCTADTIIGIAAGCASLATGGKHKPTFNFSVLHLHSSSNIIAFPYINLLKTLNPEIDSLNYDPDKPPLIGYSGDGFIAFFCKEGLEGIEKGFSNSDNFFEKHILTRLIYLLLAPSSVITRIADAIIAIVVVPLSFLTLGEVLSINNLAYRTSKAPGIIGDLIYYTIKFVNPWA